MYQVGQKYTVNNENTIMALNGAKSIEITGSNNISISGKSDIHPSLTLPYEFFDSLVKGKKLLLVNEDKEKRLEH